MKLAWRNLFRNKRRSFIAGTAIGIGLASLIFVDALIIGIKNNMIRSATASFMGDAQIHAESFRQAQEVDKTIYKYEQLKTQLDEEEIIQHWAPRVTNLVMISSAADLRWAAAAGSCSQSHGIQAVTYPGR